MYKKIFLTLLCGLLFGFSVPAEASWLTGYEYRKEITIDYTKIGSDLSDFPLAVILSDTTNIVDGNDVKFTSSDGITLLDYEMESYAVNDAAYWVNIPTVSSTTDTSFYMYYGKTGDTDDSTSAVWDENYAMVQHMEETSGTVYDSTSNANNGTPSGGLTQNADGRIGGADGFDGTDDSLSFSSSDSLDIDGAITVEAWIYPESSGSAMGIILGDGQYEVTVQANSKIIFTDSSGHGVRTTADVLTLEQWNHIVCVFNGTSGSAVTLDNTKIYVNGVSAGDTVISTPWSPDSLGGLDLGKTIVSGTETTIYDNWNVYSVTNGAVRSQNWTISEDTLISQLLTYHYNNGSGSPNANIYIKLASDGSVVWYGMSGERHDGKYHFVYPNIVLGPGTYYCTDVAGGWSYNTLSGGVYAGFLKVFTTPQLQALYDGIIDEVRISDTARSEDWITASYYSESNSLLTFGSEEGSVIPEPASLLLLGFGVAGIAMFRKI